jgi:hypothetical protein
MKFSRALHHHIHAEFRHRSRPGCDALENRHGDAVDKKFAFLFVDDWTILSALLP